MAVKASGAEATSADISKWCKDAGVVGKTCDAGHVDISFTKVKQKTAKSVTALRSPHNYITQHKIIRLIRHGEPKHLSYHSTQKATRMKIGQDSKLAANIRQKLSLKYNTIYIGKDKTMKSVCIFEQLSRNKIVIRYYTRSCLTCAQNPT